MQMLAYTQETTHAHTNAMTHARAQRDRERERERERSNIHIPTCIQEWASTHEMAMAAETALHLLALWEGASSKVEL
jgi:hypothetical protein